MGSAFEGFVWVAALAGLIVEKLVCCVLGVE
jgi:hypothetical protein